MPTGPENAALLEALSGAERVLGVMKSDAGLLARAARAGAALGDCLRGGGKVLVCGNGGSMCDAAHFAEELTGRYRADRPPLAAIACVEGGHLSCTANDYGFEHVFSRWVRALGRPGDVVVLLSTSGHSPNIVHAADAAGEMGLSRIALLGRDGGRLAGRCEHEITVPGATSDRIQELHMLILHAWVDQIERALGYVRA